MAIALGLEPVGLVAVSRDGTKLGKLKDVFSDSGSSSEYLVIGRRLARDLVIPADVVEMQDERVLVPFASSFLNSAPVVKTKGAVSPEERRRLEALYHVHAARD
jgi:ribosomal 30S subunit maturation factor RimM